MRLFHLPFQVLIMPIAAWLQAAIRPLSLSILFPHILLVRPGKGNSWESVTPTGSTESYPPHPTFCSCHWPNILNPSCITNTFLRLYHFSIHFNQFNYPEDGSSLNMLQQLKENWHLMNHNEKLKIYMWKKSNALHIPTRDKNMNHAQ
jgi:hypothetical protein